MKLKIEEKSSYEEKTQKNSSIDQCTDSKQGKSDTRVIEKYDEAEILKEQIKHLDKIIKVLEDIEARGSSLKDVRRERGWLVEYLTDTEIEIKKGNDYYGEARVHSQVDRNIEPR